MRIDNYALVGMHTLLVQRTVTVDGEDVGLNAVESYRIDAEPESKLMNDVVGVLNRAHAEESTIWYEGHDWDEARRKFCEAMISIATEEIESI